LKPKEIYKLNLIDLGVLIVIALFMFYGIRKGLVLTVFRFASFFASIALARFLYPIVSRFLRGTPLYGGLKDLVENTMGLGNLFQGQTDRILAEADLNALPIPDILKSLLVSNNTPDIYNLLRVETIEDYISGFFANIIVNVIAIALVFAISWVILSFIGRMLDLISRLPVLNSLNRAGGFAVGLLMGVAVAWVGLMLVGLLFATPAYPEVFAYMQGSLAAKWFFNSGFVMELLTGI
jgi:uncharacterized membrane protein required for colicin V production